MDAPFVISVGVERVARMSEPGGALGANVFAFPCDDWDHGDKWRSGALGPKDRRGTMGPEGCVVAMVVDAVVVRACAYGAPARA